MFNDRNIDDNYETSKEEWAKILPYIPKDKIIWSPFYCSGKQKDVFKELGFDIIHRDEDFFKNNRGDIIIDNPPFGILRPVLTRMKKLEKPFILIMPSSKINARWFQKDFKDFLQVIIPMKRQNFKRIDGKEFNFNWGTYYYCYRMRLPKDLIFL